MEVRIAGGISGQVAIGNNILQIGAVHGGVVNVAMPDQKPQPRPRRTPVNLRPRPFPGLLNREREVSEATAAFRSATPIEFIGQAGLGKTALLRHLAHHGATTTFSDGIVFLSVRDQPIEDVLQSLHTAFYESDVPFKPTEGQIRQALQGKRALVVLDDVELPREEVGVLMDFAPSCAFLMASPQRRLWGEGQSVALRGLPPDDAMALVERTLGRSLTSRERPVAQNLCTGLKGHPLRLIQVAAMVREEGRSLVDLSGQAQAPSPAEALRAETLAGLSGAERKLVAALAFLDGAPVHAEHLSRLAGLADAAPMLDRLLRRGLVQVHSPRYSLTGELNQFLQQTWDLTPWGKQALAYFARWAEKQRDPDPLLDEADAILHTMEWAAQAGRWAELLRLGRAIEGALALGRRWGAWAQVLRWIVKAAQALNDRGVAAWALHQSGTRALCLGDAATARTRLTRALRLRQALGDRAGAVVTEHNLNLLLGPPAPPREPPEKPPSSPGPSAGVSPLLKGALALTVAGFLGVVGAIGYIATRPTPTPTPLPPTARPTRTSPPPTRVPPTERPSSPVPQPEVLIELADGCFTEYDRGDRTILFVEANTEGRAEIGLDDRPFEEVWLVPEEVWETRWTFEDLHTGDHVLWVRLFNANDREIAGVECPFVLVPPTSTPVTPSPTPRPTFTHSPTPITPTPTFTPSPTPITPTPTPTPRPCVDFDDLPYYTSYYDETFTSSGVQITVDGSVFVMDSGYAGGSDNELELSYATLSFDFGGPISGLTLRFSEGGYDTFHSIEINGTSESFDRFAELDGRTIGGTTASVSGTMDESGYYGPGLLQLDGTINSFSIGADYDLYIDDVCPQ
jgi:hypothetical protein